MSTIERRQPGQLAVPQGARTLGRRVKPIIRLGMGLKVEGTRKDGSTYTRPSKTDYFTVRGEERATKKFTSVYGEKPKAVRIMVPSELALALDISYRSFVGGQSEDGGRPLALGITNFAQLGYVGGPDVLRVWRQDGTYAEVETMGLDELGKPLDEIASDLNIEVHTTFTFTIPDVLGWGSFAQVTSKGKKSADNLSFKLSEIYSAFGSQAPWAFDSAEPPLLVLRPDTALVRFEKDGEASWGKTKIFVLDIVIPEAFDRMRDRLVEHRRSLVDPVGQLYGNGAPREIAPAPADVAQEAEDAVEFVEGEIVDTPEEAPADVAAVPAPDGGDGQQAEGPEPPPSPAEPSAPGPADPGSEAPPPGEEFAGEEPASPGFKAPADPAIQEALRQANVAGQHVVGFGKYAGLTVAVIAEEGKGKPDPGYVLWMASQMQPRSDSARLAQEHSRTYARLVLGWAGDES